MRLLLLVLILSLAVAGCQSRTPSPLGLAASESIAGAAAGDPVWVQYTTFKGRAYKYTMQGWRPTGRDITEADIAQAPCKVVRNARESAYVHAERTIYLDKWATISVLRHEAQHAVDMASGITDRRELERKAMIAENL